MTRNSLRLGLRCWFLAESAQLFTLLLNTFFSGPRVFVSTGILQTTPCLLLIGADWLADAVAVFQPTTGAENCALCLEVVRLGIPRLGTGRKQKYEFHKK